jgi:hypothetical protein
MGTYGFAAPEYVATGMFIHEPHPWVKKKKYNQHISFVLITNKASLS